MEGRDGGLQAIGCIELFFLEASCSDSAILIGDCDEAGMGGCEVYRMLAFGGVGSLDN